MANDSQSTVVRRLELALRDEYAAGFPFYNDETRERLAADHARLLMPNILRAISRAGLKLENQHKQN